MGNVPSGSPTAALYQTGPKVASGVSGFFDMHEGVKRGSTAEKVSIFIFDPSKVSSEASTILTNAGQVWSSLADAVNVGQVGFDGFVRILSIDTETGVESGGALSALFSGTPIRIVTEHVIQLSELLKTKDFTEDETMLGLWQSALSTLQEQSPRFYHCNLSPSTIFVSSKTNVWKIGVDWASALEAAEQYSNISRTLPLQDPSSIPPEYASAPSIRSPEWPLHAKDSWGLSSLMLALPGLSGLLKSAPFKDLRSNDPTVRPNPSSLREHKIFRDRHATNILIKLNQLRRDESKEKQLFTSIVNDIRTGSIDSQGRAILSSYLLKASLITKPTAIESKLTQVLFSCGKSGLLASSDFSRIARPFIEWAWRLESHPLKGQLRAAVCQHVSSYLEYMTTSFAESEIYNRLTLWMKSWSQDIESALYTPDAAAGWISFVFNANAHSPIQNTHSHLYRSAETLAFDMLRMLAGCSHLAFRKRIIIATSTLMLLDHEWGDNFYDLYTSLTSVDPAASMRRFALWRLQKAVSDENGGARKMTMHKIAEFCVTRAVPLLTDTDPTVRERARKAIRKFTLLMEKRDSGAATTAQTEKPKARPTGSKPASASPSQKSSSGFDWGDDEEDDFAPISPAKPTAAAAPAPKKSAAKKSSAPKKPASMPPKQQEPPAKPVVQKLSKAGWDDWDSDWSATPAPSSFSSSSSVSAEVAVTPDKAAIAKSSSKDSLKAKTFDEDEAAGWDDFEPAITVSSMRKAEPKPDDKPATTASSWGDSPASSALSKVASVTVKSETIASETKSKLGSLKASEESPSTSWDDESSAWGADSDFEPTATVASTSQDKPAISAPAPVASSTASRSKATTWEDAETSAWGADEDELEIPKPASETKAEPISLAPEPAPEPESEPVPEISPSIESPSTSVDPTPAISSDLEADLMAELASEASSSVSTVDSPVPLSEPEPATEQPQPATSTTPPSMSEADPDVDTWGDDDLGDITAPSSAPKSSSPAPEPVKPAAQKIDISFDDEDW